MCCLTCAVGWLVGVQEKHGESATPLVWPGWPGPLAPPGGTEASEEAGKRMAGRALGLYG